jgi:hypothetical protein
MSKAETVLSKLTKTFSYGETLYWIIQEKGVPLTKMPNEEFEFPDKSKLLLTPKEVKLM